MSPEAGEPPLPRPAQQDAAESESAGIPGAGGAAPPAEAPAGGGVRTADLPADPALAWEGLTAGDPRAYINRELSLLDFQERVLEEAMDPRNPLLERLKFLAIVGSNLDEFFMVRVAGLKQQLAAGVFDLPPDGMTPAEQLAAIRRRAGDLMERARLCLRRDLMPALAEEGIRLLDYHELSDRQRERAAAYFEENVYPVLTPLAFDPGRPFPHISNLSMNLAVVIRDPDGQERFARIKVPATLPQLVPVKKRSGGLRKNGTVPHEHAFVWLDQLIAMHLDRLFPGMTVVESHPFRVTRNADMVIQELEADDLLETIEEGVRRRRFGTVTRLTLHVGMPPHIRALLRQNLAVDPNDMYALDGPLNLGCLWEIYRIERHDLKEALFLPAMEPALDARLEKQDIFEAIRRRPRLLHHPYDSFQPVVDFLRAAAHDPGVLAIKMTLYRVGRNSPVVEALLEAQENGKQVAVLVELKARFDEESNIQWARALEAQGVHVVYGLLGLKTHSKIALVVRREGGRLRRYIHLATGNYNPVTATLYTDLGFFTCDEEIGADATDLFNYLTGYSAKNDYRSLLVAPINLRRRLEELIQREIAHAEAGRPARLVFKMNALVDRPMIRLFYAASRAGVECDLIVRGICCLRPGIPGLSERIRVRSIVGRFLEHSRIFWFANDGAEEIYLGSADLMPRNINRRVEVLFPVVEPDLVRYLRHEVLAACLADNVKARRLRADGKYERVVGGEGEEVVNSQERLLRRRPSEHDD